MNTNIILGRHSLVHPARVVWIHKIIACRPQTQYVQANQRLGSYFPSCKISQKVDALNHSDDVFQNNNWAASSEFGTYRLCEQRRFRRACASAQSRQNLRCSLIQAVSQEVPSDRKPDPWPLWMAGHAQLKFVMTECSKTQIRLTRPNYNLNENIQL